MYSYSYFNSAQSFLHRYRFFLVLVIGFCGAFLLGLLLWNVTAGTPDAVFHVAGAVPATIGDGPLDEGETPGEPLDAVDPEEPLVVEATELGAQDGVATLSSVFSPEVRYWEPQILIWATDYDLDPNLVATLMQIESCGNSQAVSSAGARGLFQVMPFHFVAGEEMLDPATNARRGLDYLVQSLTLTEGHVGMALAGYNGGHTAALGSWETWPLETRRYYRWGSGIYHDVSTGLEHSPTLHDWLAAGGASLCQQAAAVLKASSAFGN